MSNEEYLLKNGEPVNLAVLTGDIVGSSNLSAERRMALYETFPVLSKMLMEQFPADVSYMMSNFRGDGWQVIVNNPGKALEISLFIRTFIRFTYQKEKLDSRIAIGIGPVQFIPKDNVSAGDGPAYLLSGRLLESLKTRRMGVDLVQSNNLMLTKSLQSMISLLDQIVISWGAGQCTAVFYALQHFTQVEIAEKWKPKPIKQASVSKSLKTAGWEQVSQALISFEELVDAALRKGDDQ